MRDLHISYIQEWNVFIVKIPILFLTYIALFTAPAIASIGAYCQCCNNAYPACGRSDRVWHPYCDCQQGFIMAIRNNDNQYYVNEESANFPRRSDIFYTHDLPNQTPSHTHLEILIPLYIYPDLRSENSRWRAVVEAQSKVDITAIINPNNGPLGDISDSRYRDYQNSIRILRNAKVKVLGYVYTSYGKRDKEQIKADIDKYSQYYDLDGIFFDEAANTTKDKDFYAQLAAYVRTADKLKTIVLNPGISTSPAYMDAQHSIADTAVTFEQTYAQWINASGPPDWVYNKMAKRFALLVHTAPDSTAMKRAIDLGHMRHYGYVYVTNDMGANPWDTLPSYWQEMVDYIKQLNDTRSAQHPPLPTRLIR